MMKPIFRRALSVLLAAACSLPAAAAARILLVPNEHPTIQQAMVAAGPGDIVRVAAGTYFENVSLRSGVTLEGGWDSSFLARDIVRNTTVIDGSKGFGPVVFGADKAAVDGFTITGGKPPMFMPDAPLGPGVYCAGASSFVVSNNLITGNNAAGIYAGFCSIGIAGNIIGANGQAGIYLEASAALIQGNRIGQNLMAGIIAGIPDPAQPPDRQLSQLEIVNNAVYSNKRAGINIAWATGKVANNLIYENEQAGIRCGSVPLLAVNNTIVGNLLAGISVAEMAAGKPLKDTAPLIKNNIIANNGQAGIKSAGLGYTYNLLYANNKTPGFYPDYLWYLRLQFGGYEDQDSLKKTKNILADPLFVNSAQHDYHLRPGSPAIDAGDPDLMFNDRHFGPSLGADTNDLGAYGGTETVAEERPANAPPVAKITPPEEQVYVGDKVALSGKDSADPNGDEIRYEWRLASKPMTSAAVLQPGKDGSCEFTADVGGQYAVQLTATDRWGLQGSPGMLNIVVDPDRPPTAKISKPDSPIKIGDAVTLFAYDKNKQNGSELTYSWSMISRPAASQAVFADSTAARPSFVADVSGCYSVKLTVSNGKKHSTPDTVHVCTKQSRIPGRREVPGEYPNIQTALDTAEAGEDVIVQPGTYKENLIVDKAVNLIGIGRPVIDGGSPKSDQAAVFVCYLDNSASGRIQGFQITGGGIGQFGHGLQLLNCSPEIVDNEIINNKHAGIGIHGMRKFTEKTRVHNNVIHDNAIGISNGLGAAGQIYDNQIYNNKISGIGMRGLSEPVIRGNTIYGNYIGIGVREEAYPLVEGNKIYDNTVGMAINPGNAGAVYAKQDKIVIRNNMVQNNRQSGIFISSLNKSDLFIQSNTVTGNSADSGQNRRSGGTVIGYPHEALVKAVMEQNAVSNNNGRDVQNYKQLVDSTEEMATSAGRRPNF